MPPRTRTLAAARARQATLDWLIALDALDALDAALAAADAARVPAAAAARVAARCRGDVLRALARADAADAADAGADDSEFEPAAQCQSPHWHPSASPRAPELTPAPKPKSTPAPLLTVPRPLYDTTGRPAAGPHLLPFTSIALRARPGSSPRLKGSGP